MNQLTFWILFNLFVVAMLVLDHGVFHRRGGEQNLLVWLPGLRFVATSSFDASSPRTGCSGLYVLRRLLFTNSLCHLAV